MGDARVTQEASLALYEAEATDARVTQSAALSLYDGATDARATQVAALAMYEQFPVVRVTQVPALALYEVAPLARATQLVTLALYTGLPCVLRRAQCWKITRLDGQTFTYTTHDEPLVYRGETYTPCNSLRASASAQSGATAGEAGDVEMSGIISDAGITEEDLSTGKFDGATVEVTLVPWDPAVDTGIARRITKGIVARLEHSPTQYKATVLTSGSKLIQSPMLTTYTPACRWNLGSTECGVVLDSSDTSIGSVTEVYGRNAVNQVTFRKFQDSTRAEAAGYFQFGSLTWTSGLNNGLSAEVKYFDSGVFELWDVMPYEIAIGDDYEVTPGCGKTTTDCTSKFNNLINFGGFPNVPGKDSIYETPDAK